MDQKLVQDRSQLQPLCDKIYDSMKNMCDTVDLEIGKFKETMHGICADPYMASTETNSQTQEKGFTYVLREVVKELGQTLDKNYGSMVDVLTGTMRTMLTAHGFSESPTGTKKGTLSFKEPEAFYASLVQGGVGVPDKATAQDNTKKAINDLATKLSGHAQTLKSDIQSILANAFKEETLQNAAQLLGSQIIKITEKGMNSIAQCASSHIGGHVQLLASATNAAAKKIDEVRSSANTSE